MSRFDENDEEKEEEKKNSGEISGGRVIPAVAEAAAKGNNKRELRINHT